MYLKLTIFLQGTTMNSKIVITAVALAAIFTGTAGAMDLTPKTTAEHPNTQSLDELEGDINYIINDLKTQQGSDQSDLDRYADTRKDDMKMLLDMQRAINDPNNSEPYKNACMEIKQEVTSKIARYQELITDTQFLARIQSAALAKWEADLAHLRKMGPAELSALKHLVRCELNWLADEYDMYC
jgi:hypothetical protein